MAKRILSYSHNYTDYITIEEAKQHLRLYDEATDDLYVGNLLSAAFSICSDYVGYSIIKAKANYTFEGTDTKGRLLIPARVLSVVAAYYYDTNAAAQTLTLATAPHVYGNFGYYGYVNDLPASSNAYGDKFMVQVYEGFDIVSSGSGDTYLPDSIRSAIYLTIGTLYDNRQNEVIGATVEKLPMNAEYLLNPYRIIRFV